MPWLWGRKTVQEKIKKIEEKNLVKVEKRNDKRIKKIERARLVPEYKKIAKIMKKHGLLAFAKREDVSKAVAKGFEEKTTLSALKESLIRNGVAKDEFTADVQIKTLLSSWVPTEEVNENNLFKSKHMKLRPISKNKKGEVEYQFKMW